MQNIELLAPAGSFEALKAALQNGADAVYLGGTEFSARAYASNFDRDTLKEAISYSHIRGMKVYVTVNTLLKDLELDKLLEYVGFLYDIDVDSLIIQDLGVLKIIREVYPDFELHCSTQMTLHNTHGVQAIKELGIKRVVLARELTLAEIKEIREKTGMELEVFVHGALCVSYSGQCLMSSFIGGRSGNRGRCAQPCRRAYQLVSSKGENEKKELYHISMRDLNTFDEIGLIIDSGVTSFKIEGRMKKPQYVASIVGAYRRAIDHYLTEGKPFRSLELQQEMTQMFNRRFTKGYILESSRDEIVNVEKPNNRGTLLGSVIDYNPRKNRLKLKLLSKLSAGYGIEVWGPKTSDTGGTVVGLFVDNEAVKQAEKGQVVEIEIKGDVSKGDEVFKTLDINLMKDLEKTYDNNIEAKKIIINGDIKLYEGKPIQLMLWDNDSNTVFVESEQAVERAIRLPLTREKLMENLNKLGNTPYAFEEVQVDLEDGIAVPLSMINGLRRDAIEKLNALRENRNHREPRGGEQQLPAFAKASRSDKIELKDTFITVKVDTISQLKAVLAAKIDRLYYGDINTLQEAIALCKEAKVSVYFRTSGIMKNTDYKRLEAKLETTKPDGILAGDLGMLDYSRRALQIPAIADMSLNVMNSHTISFVQEMEAAGVVISPELDLKSINQLTYADIDGEAIIYGKLPIMTMEYCPLKDKKQCNLKCKECSYPPYRYHWGIKDAKQMTFQFAKDCWGRTVFLNSQPLFMLDKLKDLKKTPIKSYRLDFTDETEAEIKEIFEHLEKQLEALADNTEVKEDFPTFIKVGGFTRGHYYRGVE